MATSSLLGRDQPRRAAVSILEGICQDFRASSLREALLLCELTGPGLGAKRLPEEMEFRWPKKPQPSALLACLLGPYLPLASPSARRAGRQDGAGTPVPEPCLVGAVAASVTTAVDASTA